MWGIPSEYLLQAMLNPSISYLNVGNMPKKALYWYRNKWIPFHIPFKPYYYGDGNDDYGDNDNDVFHLVTSILMVIIMATVMRLMMMVMILVMNLV